MLARLWQIRCPAGNMRVSRSYMFIFPGRWPMAATILMSDQLHMVERLKEGTVVWSGLWSTWSADRAGGAHIR